MGLLTAVASVVVVAAHLALVYVALGAPFVVVWLAWRDMRRGDALAGEVARRLTGQALGALTVAVLLGAVAGGILWIEHAPAYWAAVRQMPLNRYWFGVAEIVFFFACMACILALWRPQHRSAVRLLGIWALALLAGTNLAYHFPTLFSMLGVLSTRPELWGKDLSFTALLADREVLARTMHHELAAFAVTGVALASQALRLDRAGRADDARRVAAWGACVALAATCLAAASGVYLATAAPAGIQAQILGGDLAATSLLGAGVVGTIMLINRLAGVALGDASRREIVGAMATLAVVLVCMVGARHRSRAPALDRAERAVAAQPSSGAAARAPAVTR